MFAEGVRQLLVATVEDDFVHGQVAGAEKRYALKVIVVKVRHEQVENMSSLGLGAVYDNALEVFSGDNAALDMIRSAGERAGVAG